MVFDTEVDMRVCWGIPWMDANASEDLAEPLTRVNMDGVLTMDKFIDSADKGFVRRAVLPLAIGNAADAVEILSAGYIMSDFRQEDGSYLTSTQKELLTAAVFVGMLIGGLLAGSMADRYGRRYCLLVSLGVNFTFGALSAAAPSVGWLIAARVFAGVGVGGSIPVVFTLGAELFPTRIRGVMVSIIASFWMVGSIFASTAAWIILGDDFSGDRITLGGTWRHYALVAALPAATSLLLTVLFVPESPRFLAKAGRFDEMTAVLRRITNAPVYISCEAFEKPRSIVRTDVMMTRLCNSWRDSFRRLYVSVPTNISEGAVPSDTSVSTDEDRLDASHGNGRSMPFGSGVMRVVCPGNDSALRRSTIVLIVVWFTLSYGTYGVATWNNQLFADIGLSNPYLCSFIYALSSLPGNVCSIVLVERVGRKRLLSVSMASAAAAATLFALGTGAGEAIILTGASLFNAFSTCGWNALGVVSTEAFPTAARASGMGLVSAAGRLGSIAAQFVNGSLESSVLGLLMVTSGLTLLGGVASLLLPRDTTGTSLEERPAGP